VGGPESGVGFRKPKRRPKAKVIIPHLSSTQLAFSVAESRPAALKSMPSSATQRTTFEFLLVIAGIASGDWWFYKLALDGE
jgi:hypothetical protein